MAGALAEVAIEKRKLVNCRRMVLSDKERGTNNTQTSCCFGADESGIVVGECDGLVGQSSLSNCCTTPRWYWNNSDKRGRAGVSTVNCHTARQQPVKLLFASFSFPPAPAAHGSNKTDRNTPCSLVNKVLTKKDARCSHLVFVHRLTLLTPFCRE